MHTITSKEAQNKFGSLIDKAQKEPVTVQRHGRDVVVVMSIDDYRRLQALEDSIWLERAKTAAKSGYLGPEKSVEVIRELLNADTES